MLATTSTPLARRNSTVSLNSTSISIMVVAPQPFIMTKALSPALRPSLELSAPATVATVSFEDIHRHAHAAALAVLSGAYLHHVRLAEVAEGHPVLRMRGVGGLDGDGGHVVGVMLGDLRHLVEVLALAGGSGGDVIERNGAGKAALVVLAVGVILYLFAGDDLAEVESGLLSQLYGLLAREAGRPRS